MASILIIDDDQMFSMMLSGLVQEMGHSARCSFSLSEGVLEASSGRYDVVFLDVRLPDGNGLEALPKIRETEISPEVIIITGAGETDGAALAIRCGAWDYIEKPSSIQKMTLQLTRALQYREERGAAHREVNVLALDREGIVGATPKMRACFNSVAQVANTDTNVLITGETGTGKELFALAIHRNSPRSTAPFVVVDCSSLPETLVESMLFGHTKGAFTGADKAKDGLILQANGGTLFLDEVGEMPLTTQKSFLRVLQERRFRPIGGKEEIRSDFRLVAATNRDLQQLTDDGSFRSDLLFRLRSYVIEIPPLRERSEDIAELAMHHLVRVCARHGTGLKGFSPEFMDTLCSYHWPGNVRELNHAMERALAAARFEPTLYPKHLPDEIRIHLAQASLSRSLCDPVSSENSTPPDLPKLREYREIMDRQYLQDLMAHTEGDIKTACRLSGLSRSRLYELLKHHAIPLPS